MSDSKNQTSQSAPVGEREAFEAWSVKVGNAYVTESGYVVWKHENECGELVAFQAGAAWQRTQSAGVPEGWRLVPVEPTPEMAKVSTWDMNSFYSASKVWAAMLAAIQQAKGEEVEVVAWISCDGLNDLKRGGSIARYVVPSYSGGAEIALCRLSDAQRITAAMAAEVETWKGMTKEAHEYHSAAMIELARILGGDVSDEPRLKWVCGIAIDVVSERDALRAELSAVKGQGSENKDRK